ncbi:MAG: hypothetical protein U9Q68_07645 [Euryarchaeota archaeon]|nr:hypothetical protein [Euryarchaeota archaeon]
MVLLDLAYVVVATTGIVIIMASELMDVSKGILLFMWLLACVISGMCMIFRRYFNAK